MHLTDVGINISDFVVREFVGWLASRHPFSCVRSMCVQSPGLNVCSLKFALFTLGSNFRLNSRLLFLSIAWQRLITILTARISTRICNYSAGLHLMLYTLNCREPDGYVRNIPLICTFILLLCLKDDEKTKFETADIRRTCSFFCSSSVDQKKFWRNML